MPFWQFFRQGRVGRELLVRPSRIPHRIAKIVFALGADEFLAILEGKTREAPFYRVQSNKITVCTVLMFPICLPVFFLFTQTTWFYLSCQFLSHTVNFFKFDKTGRVEGSLTGFFFRISLRQGFHLILHTRAEAIMKLHLCVFLSTNVGLYRTWCPVLWSRNFSKSRLSRNWMFSFLDTGLWKL